MAILAGQRIRALDFAGYASVYDFANDELNLTAGVFTAPPTQVGVAFTAPSSGSVKCDFGGRIRQYPFALRVVLACELRTGAVIGSGTVVEEADADRALEIGYSPDDAATTQLEASTFRVHSGLTPGSLYHFRIMVSAADVGTGNEMGVYSRYIAVQPWHG